MVIGDHSWSLVCTFRQDRHELLLYVRKRVELQKYSNVFKPVDEQSSDKEKPTTVDDVQDNGVGDDMQDFIEERQPTSRRSTRNQRPVNRFGLSIPSPAYFIEL